MVAALRLFTIVLLWLTWGTAYAQTSFGAAVATDYRYRGLSLSKGGAVAQVYANIDGDWGGYAGATLSSARLPYLEVHAIVIAYAGYARRFGEGLSWETGVTHSAFQGAANYDYHEFYAGLGAERIVARVYVSPHYYGLAWGSTYVEVNGSYPLSERLDLSAHVGALKPRGADYTPATRSDLRIGLDFALEQWTLQVAWTGSRENARQTTAGYGTGSHKLMAAAMRSF